MKSKEILVRSLINIPSLIGIGLIALGFGQFFLFFGLDALGVIEIGNGLGHGLLLWFSVHLGVIIFLLGAAFTSVKALLRRP